MNFLSTVVAAFLLLGNAFSFSLWGHVKRDVVIDGIDVSGLTYAQAESVLRENLMKKCLPLVVHAPSGDLVIDNELSVTDNAAYLVRKAKRGEQLFLTYSRQWADMESALFELCLKNARTAANAEITFSEEGFSYQPEVPGLACDLHHLFLDVAEALSSDKNEVTLHVQEYAPEITEKTLRERSQKLASFTTWFDEDNTSRTHNIALAASRISGSILAPGEVFSFNAVVGERSETNGFRVAAIILDGEFVPGVGGGVCQASSTLFGAALRAGLTVTESHAHSLSVGYVPPSLDAMVSSASDLKFINSFDFPVYILGKVRGGSVTFSIYGLPDGNRYETESVVLSHIPPAAPEIVEGEEDKILRAEKEGILSESYLVVCGADGTLISRTRIRRDCYSAVQGKLMKKPVMELPDGAFDAQAEEEEMSSKKRGEENIAVFP